LRGEILSVEETEAEEEDVEEEEERRVDKALLLVCGLTAL
jgi:hypothetical protein